MKKLTLTIAILLGISSSLMAQPMGGGLFQRGDETHETSGNRNANGPMLPTGHGLPNDQPAETPLEGGAALLFGLAVMYLTRKHDHHD